MAAELYDVTIIGAGPAGLNAALVLGRSRRRVLLLDGGPPRNARTTAAHSVFTRDHSPPMTLKRLALTDLERYPVDVRQAEATAVMVVGECFDVRLSDGQLVRSRKLLLASGLRDLLPDIPGFRDGWGRTVLHCPYCDAWEHQQQRLAVYGTGDAAHHMALTLRLWSDEVTLLTGGPSGFSREQCRDLARLGVQVRELPVTRLAGTPLCITLDSGEQLVVDALFYSPAQEQRSPLPARLGCRLTANGRVEVDDHGLTSVPGIYAAGDMTPSPQYVMNAAASGVTAGIAINTALVHQERVAQGANFHKAGA
ncbi:NAD(P)/FAD-dependent oxidoreductase [Deinococcus sonorensis]|uniref:NAD(P)/FAD-dependent oxidoreductase n=2 Tax=Deinococcus sonorensis TaxID=309891 RepID=A0AAU7UAG9_9DEIO